jgi:N-acetylneuraminic acid mutarotase
MRRFLWMLCLLICSTPVLAQQKHSSISLEQRIIYQKAVEGIYWKHMIWPASNPQPKPPLEAAMSESAIRLKTEEYLRKSNALASYWHRPVTPEQLQEEMDRMAKETLDSNLLRELWAALDNDPYLIAECLARPLLVARFTQEVDGFDKWWNQKQDAMPMLAETSAHQYRLPQITDSVDVSAMPVGAAANSWKPTTKIGAPTGRNTHTAVWTGTEMIIWGGWDDVYYQTGGRYSPSTNSWVATTTTGAPTERAAHTAVWTGTEMIVWGGFLGSKVLRNGARYNPLTDSWISVTTTGAPKPRYRHTAIWTGSEMIVWGGGGRRPNSVLRSGGRYDPSTDSWHSTKLTGAPSPRAVHTAVWTGTEMLIWGGLKYLESGSIALGTGGRYNPSTNTWTKITNAGAPYKRTSHTAVWTGTEMLVWTGTSDSDLSYKTGGRYDPSTDTWRAISTSHAPIDRYLQTAVWTGTEMIIWGGFFGENLKTGARYDPVSDTWTPTKTKGAPAGRTEHTAIWTGSQMIVWGGHGNKGDLKSGGRYTP